MGEVRCGRVEYGLSGRGSAVLVRCVRFCYGSAWFVKAVMVSHGEVRLGSLSRGEVCRGKAVTVGCVKFSCGTLWSCLAWQLG